ncbi:MAG: hypothetical protein IPP44_30745 [Ideonella sp.]|nr:hypothetical protein [Ideonella sp.]
MAGATCTARCAARRSSARPLDAVQDGVGMVSTLMLADTADRTAYAVFEPGAPG